MVYSLVGELVNFTYKELFSESLASLEESQEANVRERTRNKGAKKRNDIFIINLKKVIQNNIIRAQMH